MATLRLSSGMAPTEIYSSQIFSKKISVAARRDGFSLLALNPRTTLPIRLEKWLYL
jgi:hypothetical protein